LNIAKNYLIPKLQKEYCFIEEKHPDEKLIITDAALMKIINNYCGYEAGVRNLAKCLDRIFRKIVAKMEFKKIKELEG
jgi:ATP-dependent Lon protease